MDMIGAAVTMVSVLSERRLNRMTNPALSVGLSAPASIMSIPAAADQEDFVSMGMNTAIKNEQIIDNAYGILGIEFVAAAQALDFREFPPGKGISGAKKVIRKYVDHLTIPTAR